LAVCLAQKVCVDEMGEGRKHPLGIVGGLLCKVLKFGGDGW
jgi:hypothetical protein